MQEMDPTVDPSVRGGAGRFSWLVGHPLRAAALGVALAALLIVAIAPLRTAATFALSRAILVVTSPFAPDVGGFAQLAEPSTVVAADGTPLGPVANIERRPVALADVPPHVRQAVLAAEDADFYRHDGVDPSAIVRAAFNMAKGQGTQGGSTITQQLAKINYTDGQRTFFRKLREVLYATELEKSYSKDQLLERYLNQVYFGEATYGIGAAAERTFGVPVQQLTPEQAALLAGRIRSPGSVDPRRNPERALRTRNAVLASMAERGWLPEDQLEARQATPLEVIALPPGRRASHFLELVKREVAKLPQLGDTPDDRLSRVTNNSFTIEATLDPKAQKAAEEATRRRLAPGEPSAAVISVQPGDGAVRVLVGDSQGGAFDVATQGRRQPGSSFKPLVYVAALQRGIHPATRFDSSSPKTLQGPAGPFTVSNAEEGTGGPMSIDEATVGSVNVVYSQLALRVGLDRVVRVGRQLGYPEQAPNPAIALGGLREGVSGLEQAAAYAAFANRGVWHEPYSILRIKDAEGRVVYQHRPVRRQAIKRTEAAVVNAVLQRVVTEGTGRRAGIGRPVAGKTGTTNDVVDAWFVGYTPQLSTAVWVGFPDAARPMPRIDGRTVYGGTIPAEVFAETMRAAHAGLPVRPLETARPEQLGLRPPGGREAPPPDQAAATTAPPTAPPETAPTVPPPTNATVPPGRSPGAGPPTTQCPPKATTSTSRPRGRDQETTTTSSTSTSTTTTTTTAPPGC